MDQLGLDMTRPCKDLFTFMSNKGKLLGLIKDLIISLAQIPGKTLVMDVVMVDTAPNFGMLLSRYWEAKIKSSLEMSFSNIPVFGI